MSAAASPRPSSFTSRRALALGFALVSTAPSTAGAESAAAPAVIEGDILVSSAASVLGLRGVGPGESARRWSHGEVPYVIDATLDPVRHRAIDEAVARWNAAGIVTLVAVAPGAPVPVDRLVFQSGEGCASWVGRQGGPQAVWIGPSCSAGSVMHEIGHALGLEHEHTRPDRDAHVRVLWENILPDKRHNFDPAPHGARLLGDYDIESIMHYGPANFSIDGRATLEPLDPVGGARMGQRDAPSAGDLDAVTRLYASDLALETRLDDEVAVREVTLYVTNQHDQGAHDVRVTLLVGDAAPVVPAAAVQTALRNTVGGATDRTLVEAGGRETPAFAIDPSSDANWRCAGSAGWIDCRLERLGGGAASRLVLTLEAPASGSSLHARVGSRTPDLDPANNGDRAVPESGAPTAPALAPAFADPFVVSDDAATDDPARASGGGATSGWAVLGALVALLRRRRAGRADGDPPATSGRG